MFCKRGHWGNSASIAVIFFTMPSGEPEKIWNSASLICWIVSASSVCVTRTLFSGLLIHPPLHLPVRPRLYPQDHHHPAGHHRDCHHGAAAQASDIQRSRLSDQQPLRIRCRCTFFSFLISPQGPPPINSPGSGTGCIAPPPDHASVQGLVTRPRCTAREDHQAPRALVIGSETLATSRSPMK